MMPKTTSLSNEIKECHFFLKILKKTIVGFIQIKKKKKKKKLPLLPMDSFFNHADDRVHSLACLPGQQTNEPLAMIKRRTYT